MSKKRPPLALNITPSVDETSQGVEPQVEPEKQRSGKLLVADYKKTTLYLHPKVAKALRMISAEEDVSQHDLYLEGIETVLEKRGMGTIKSISEG